MGVVNMGLDTAQEVLSVVAREQVCQLRDYEDFPFNISDVAETWGCTEWDVARLVYLGHIEARFSGENPDILSAWVFPDPEHYNYSDLGHGEDRLMDEYND